MSTEEAQQSEEEAPQTAHLMALAIDQMPPNLLPDPPHAQWFPMVTQDPEGKKVAFGVQVVSTTNSTHAYWYNIETLKLQIKTLLELLPIVQQMEASFGNLTVATPADFDAMVGNMKRIPGGSILLPPGA